MYYIYEVISLLITPLFLSYSAISAFKNLYHLLFLWVEIVFRTWKIVLAVIVVAIILVVLGVIICLARKKLRVSFFVIFLFYMIACRVLGNTR